MFQVRRASSFRIAAALAGVAAWISPAARGQVIIDVGTVPNCTGSDYSIVRALSANGTTVGGDTGCEAFKYVYPSGTVSMGASAGELNALGPDGTVGVGAAGFSSGYHAAGFLPGGFINDMGTLPNYPTSYAYGLSADTVVAAGQCYRGGDTPGSRAFRWTFSTGMVDLGTLGGNLAIATAVSGDGSTIVGAATTANGPYHAARWRQEFANEDLGELSPGAGSGANAVNPNGTIVVGAAADASFHFHGIRWREGSGLEDLGLAPGWPESHAGCLTPDGLAVGGSCGNSSVSIAAVWTQTHGWTDLNTLLPTMGVNLAGWTLTELTGISSDGTVLAGNGAHNGVSHGWMVRGIGPVCGPRIDVQPISVYVCVGSTGHFSVMAFPPEPAGHITFHWARRFIGGDGEATIVPINDGPSGNGSTYSGTSTPDLSINATTPGDGGQYVCYITAGCGSVYTVPVTLSIVPQPPAITGVPLSTTKCTGATITFSASAGPVAAAPFTVTWKKAGVPVDLNNARFTVTTNANGTASTLKITNIQLSDQTTSAGGYTCVFANACGGLPAGPASFTVWPDFNGTGVIDSFDLAQVLNNFGKNEPPFTNGDLNGDGVVNSIDLGFVLSLFGYSCP